MLCVDFAPIKSTVRFSDIGGSEDTLKVCVVGGWMCVLVHVCVCVVVCLFF